MATAKLSEMVGRLGRRVESPDPPASDADLVARFAATRDEPAFAELVRRHAGLVFGVCRRVTGNHHLAEDASQAVFVVLAAKACAIRPRHAVAGWLYGVAYRTALRARTMADRRRRHERASGGREPTVHPEQGAYTPRSPEHDELAALLDEEIAALSDAYRLPVVLCELEGRSRTDVAAELGIPEGTLSSRLAAARKVLAARLRNRGVALSAAGLSVALGQLAGAKAPPGLIANATAALTPHLVPAPVAALSHGVLRVMFLQKLKTVVPVLGLLAAGVFAAFATGSTVPAPANTKPEVNAPGSPKPAAQAKPAPAGPNKILVMRAGKLILIDPDGKNEKPVSDKGALYHPGGGAQLSPDGKALAVQVQGPQPPDDGTPGPRRWPTSLHVRGLDEKEPGTDLGIQCQMFCWSPDGTQIACSEFEDGPGTKVPEVTHTIVNVKTKEKTPLKLPANHVMMNWSGDGKYILTMSVDASNKDAPKAQLHLMNRDGTEHKGLTDGSRILAFGRLSPDGTRVLCMEIEMPKDKPKMFRKLVTVDVVTGKISPVEDVPLNAELQGFCWSPDSKKIAYAWREVHDGKPEEVREKETESHLVVADADGKNAKTIVSEKGQNPGQITLGAPDWR